MDREKTPHYWLSVSVTDLGTEPLSSRAHVYLDVLDVNDNAPQPSQPVYFASVEENADAGGSVAQVSATDADASSQGKLSFHLLESHRVHFDVDPQTGNHGRGPALLGLRYHHLEQGVSRSGPPGPQSGWFFCPTRKKSPR